MKTKFTVIASFDDGVKEDLILSEMMKKYDIPTIFYFPVHPLVVNEPNGRVSLTPAERKYISRDHEIGSHTMTHPLLTRIPIAEAINQIFNSKIELMHEFGQDINSFCYPRGYANPELEMTVKDAGYTNARGVGVGYIDKPENPFYTNTTVHVGCDRKEYAGLSWLEYALKMITLCGGKSIYSIFGHGWEISRNNSWQKLEMLLGKLADR